MNKSILDFIDFEKVDVLLEGFNKTTGFVTAILDLKGKVLSKSGWRKMCTDFHRVNPETSNNCTISDTILAGKFAKGEKYHFYKCLNGLVDVALPIVIKGEHIANLFSGQFFFEKPDLVFFKKQADKYGFDEKKYFESIEQVPVISKEKVLTAMDFLLNMTKLISEMTLQKMEQTLLNKEIQNSKEYNRSLFTESIIGLALATMDGQFIDANPSFCNIIGRSLAETVELTNWDITPEKYFLKDAEQLKILENTGKYGPYEKEYIQKDGLLIAVRMKGSIIEKEGEKYILSSVEDITDRKQSEDALKKNEERLRSVFTAMSEGFSIQDVICDDSGNPCDLRFIDANPAFEIQTGLKNEEIFGRTLLELFPTSEHYWIERYGNVGLTGEPISFEAMFGPLNIYYHVNAFQTKPGQFGTMFTNINERKQAEIVLRDEKEQKKAILEFVGDPIFLKDNDHRIVFANSAFFDLFGLDEKSVIGKTLAENVPENERKHFLQVDRKVLDTGITDYREEDLTIGEQTKTIMTRKTRFIDESGNKFLVGSIHDLTERKIAEEELKTLLQREHFLADIIRNASLAVGVGYPNGKLGMCNNAFQNLTGYSEDELKKIQWNTVLTPVEWIQHESKQLEIVDQTKKAVKYEKEYIHKKGHKIPIELVVNPFFDEEGNVTHYFAFISNLTEKKKNIDELILAKEKAEESDRLKSAFLANMSHEIRTPMNGILGFANLLKTPGLSGESQQEYIEVIEKGGARMLNILHEIVQISKIESGEMNLNISEININEKVEYIHNLLKLDFDQKRIHLSYKSSLSDKAAKIKTDEEKLFGILTNLLKNAIKYTDKGFVEFGYNLKRNFIEFYVKDSGIGIPKARQKAIFERFIQADIADMEAREGAGLGLSIAKAFVEMLGGKIWVESDENNGSTFYFTIKYEPVNKEEIINRNELPILKEGNINGGLNILIVEDDEASQYLISIIVDKFAKNILMVSSGIEAVEACKKNTDIDLILMDIRLPDMNGYEATRQIRQFNKDVIIIAQTAFAMAGDKEKSIEIGCNDYISKPIKKGELLSMVQRHAKNV